MPLLLAPSRAEAAYLDPGDDDYDPLRHVRYPRERKPRKRDREAVRVAMQGAINQRCWANVDAHGFTLDHSLRFRALNHARYEIWRHFFLDAKRIHPTVHAEYVARLKRCLLAARKYAQPNLPGDNP